MRISAFGIAALFINLTNGCLLGAPAPGGDTVDTGDTADESTEDTTGEDTGYCAIPAQVTLREGHFFTNLGTSSMEEFWLDDDSDDDVVVVGQPDGYWLLVDVESSAYSVDYTVDSGTRVDLDCDMRWLDEDGDEHSYCWNEGVATLEAFGVSCIPAGR